MIVKVCGMREPENIRAVADLGPDMMGFIHVERSPRYVSDPVMKPDGVECVAVTIDMPVDELTSLGYGTVQLHGRESADECRELRRRGLRVIKAVQAGPDCDFAAFGDYEGAVDYLLLDTASAMRGGSGQKFDWNLLDRYTLKQDFILSGGIGPDDAEALRQISHPRFAGIDLNSKFEISPAFKNVELLKNFLDNIRK